MRDETASSATMRGRTAPDTEADTALDALTGLASAVSAISGCIPMRVAISYKSLFLPVLAPVMGANSADQGVFIFQAGDSGLAFLSVPGISTDVLGSSGCFGDVSIDSSNTSIIAFIDAISSGIWTDPFGVDLATFKIAYRRKVR